MQKPSGMLPLRQLAGRSRYFLRGCASQTPDIHLLSAVVKQHLAQQVGGGASRHNIVYQCNVPAAGRSKHVERMAQVAQALIPGHALLRWRWLLARQAMGLQLDTQLAA
jgi:hypothetical protein